MSTATDTAAVHAGYKQPPADILDVMHASAIPIPAISPTKDRLLLVSYHKYPSIDQVATPYLRLAGVRVEPNHNKRNTEGGHGIRTYAKKFQLVTINDGKTIDVQLPANARVTSPLWNANGQHFVFQNITPDAVELWVGNGHTGAVERVPNVRLNPMLDVPVRWMPDQKKLLVKLVPEGQGAPPKEPPVPAAPTIEESDGKKGVSSTYEARDTLKNKHDEDLFDYYAASQLALVAADSLKVEPIGQVDRYTTPSASPDGNYLLVKAVRKPYTYSNSYERFPYDVSVWNISQLPQIKTQLINSIPLANRVPIRGVSLGPRRIGWRSNVPASLIWVEALDQGDWKNDVEHRDKVMLLEAPFDKEPKEALRTEFRFHSFAWGETPDFSIMVTYDINKQWERRFIVNIDDPKQEPKLIVDISYQERYAYPGDVIMYRLPNGYGAIYQADGAIFLSGEGSSKDGDRPFLDRLDLETSKVTRLFRSTASTYEEFIAFTDENASKFLTVKESPSEPPNIIYHTLGDKVDATEGEAVFTSQFRAVTNIINPTPSVSQIKKRVVTYERDDGVKLSFQLHTPPGYKEGTRIPTILYAYPHDFADSAQAGQVSGSEAHFTRLRKHQFLLLAGYAIIENAAFPIVGDPKEAYNTYLEQLVANAKAAVDKAVELGVTDPDRVGVTGHSHGALMTANLLAHSDIFRTGVATSGAYNKSLTPFGFQNERRPLWDALEVYRKASPFFFADKFDRPILLVHGADDANPGTTPMQSSNFYAALRGNGVTAKLVMLPFEPHHYQAKESNEHLVYEMITWFDKYLKGPLVEKAQPKI